MSGRPAWPPPPARRDVGQLVQAAIDDAAICGAVVSAGEGGDGRRGWAAAFGLPEPTDPAAPMRVDTVFDLASLTKVTATLPVILTLAHAGEVCLDDPACRFLPQLRNGAADRITLRHLLAHTSGLPAARRYYREFGTAERMREAVLAERPATAPGTVTTYSDIGFLLLGFVAEAVTGVPLDTAARSLVFDPLGMARTRFNPVSGDPGCAPTEALDGTDALRGVVHDRNALLLGGVAGHAGLFAPAGDLARYLGTWLGQTVAPWGEVMTVEALRRQTPVNGPARGLGWVLADRDSASLFSNAWPAGGAGHTGFTGTSVAIDPHAGHWIVLLTNAIRYGREKTRLTRLRRDIHRRLVT